MRNYRWLTTYVRQGFRRHALRPTDPVHVLLCIADHYEPGNGNVSAMQADARVDAWTHKYPRLFSKFRDSDGRPPQHTFFYPLEMYRATEVERIARLCREGFGEVEIHLHHDGDTAENLRRTLVEYKNLLAHQHGLLSRDRETGEIMYGFVHGNWALDNSHPAGLGCGINNELDILQETGCYADFTLPSYPSPTQTRKVNSIYYAVDDPAKPKSHDWGVDVGTRAPPARALMMIQGPLVLNWQCRKYGIVPRVENGCLQANQLPSRQRVNLWLRAHVHVRTRPDWFFVKLHTHGAVENNQQALLGEPMVRFHEMLALKAAADPNFHYYYVTAREMYNLAKAAEAGRRERVCELRDFQLFSVTVALAEK
jgi:hypothetical protein